VVGRKKIGRISPIMALQSSRETPQTETAGELAEAKEDSQVQ